MAFEYGDAWKNIAILPGSAARWVGTRLVIVQDATLDVWDGATRTRLATLARGRCSTWSDDAKIASRVSAGASSKFDSRGLIETPLGTRPRLQCRPRGVPCARHGRQNHRRSRGAVSKSIGRVVRLDEHRWPLVGEENDVH